MVCERDPHLIVLTNRKSHAGFPFMLKCSQPSPISPLHHIGKAVHVLFPVLCIPYYTICNSENFSFTCLMSVNSCSLNTGWNRPNVVLRLVHTADTDKQNCLTCSLSCPCRRCNCEQKWRQDKTVLSCLHQFAISNLQLFSLKYIED